MKHRLKTLLLALGLTAAVFSVSVYAQEETDGIGQAAQSELEELEEEFPETEAQAESEGSSEAETAQEESEGSSEAGNARTDSADASDQTEAVSQEDQLKEYLSEYLVQVSAWTDEQVDELAASTDGSVAALIALNWQSVRGELGNFVEVTDAEISADGMSIIGHAVYDRAGDDADVVVSLNYAIDPTQYTMTVESIEWEVSYPTSVLLQRAAMNTVIGLAVVFAALFFLSFLIGKLHYIPDLIESRAGDKEEEPVSPQIAALAQEVNAVPAQTEAQTEEVCLQDQLELAAVIAAAIAASEGQTSADGYVVRSIRRVNKSNWRRA